MIETPASVAYPFPVSGIVRRPGVVVSASVALADRLHLTASWFDTVNAWGVPLIWVHIIDTVGNIALFFATIHLVLIGTRLGLWTLAGVSRLGLMLLDGCDIATRWLVSWGCARLADGLAIALNILRGDDDDTRQMPASDRPVARRDVSPAPRARPAGSNGGMAAPHRARERN